MKSPQTTQLFLVRHAESEGNVQNQFGGDFPLSARGVEQVRALAEQLSDVKFVVAYSSPLQRARQTAQLLLENRSRPATIRSEPDLRERWYGSLELEQISPAIRDLQIKLAAENPELLWDHHLVSDDESNRQAFTRFYGALQRIAIKHQNKRILVVSHGNVIRTLLVHLGVGHFGQIGSGTFRNASYAQLVWSNDTFSIADLVGLHMTATE